MKVALVHEFLTQLGGAERVLEVFHKIFPGAPVFTLVYDRQRTRRRFDGWDIRTSFLQKMPGGTSNYKWYLMLMARATESFNFFNYDLVLSDSSAFAKGVIIKKPTIHICYCHTPTRYLWQDMEDYVSSIKYAGSIRAAAKFYLKNFLKSWDYKAAQRPDFLIANSKTVRERIKKYYNRVSEVIYPPVDTEFFYPAPSDRGVARQGAREEGYFFTASRLEPYKKIGLVIEAFNQLGWPLKVAGDGTEMLNLKSKIKNPKIELLGRVSDEELRDLYRHATAFIFPAEEDAGIMILEALACGTPVIAYGKGGASEFIRDGENGLLFFVQTLEALTKAIKGLETRKFDPKKLRQSVLQFDEETFTNKIVKFVHENRR